MLSAGLCGITVLCMGAGWALTRSSSLGCLEIHSQVLCLGGRCYTNQRCKKSSGLVTLSLWGPERLLCERAVILAQAVEGERRDMGKGWFIVGDIWEGKRGLSVQVWEPECGKWRHSTADARNGPLSVNSTLKWFPIWEDICTGLG